MRSTSYGGNGRQPFGPPQPPTAQRQRLHRQISEWYLRLFALSKEDSRVADDLVQRIAHHAAYHAARVTADAGSVVVSRRSVYIANCAVRDATAAINTALTTKRGFRTHMRDLLTDNHPHTPNDAEWLRKVHLYTQGHCDQIGRAHV